MTEGLPDRDQRVFALGRVGMGLVDDDLFVLGHRDAKLDLEAAAPMSGLQSTSPFGGFEPAVGTVLRVWLVMEAAVGERPAEALVEEQEEQGHLDAFLREAVGVA